MKGTSTTTPTGTRAPTRRSRGVRVSRNVVAGRGNIKASEHHAKDVAHWLTEHYLGIQATEPHDSLRATHGAEARAEAAATQVAAYVESRPLLPAAAADALIDRIRARQAEVGYDGYAAVDGHGHAARMPSERPRRRRLVSTVFGPRNIGFACSPRVACSLELQPAGMSRS